MLRRLLLLLSLLMALPVAAAPACHAPAEATATMAHGHGKHHAPAAPEPAHACLGCVPPATLLPGVLRAPPVLRAPLGIGPVAARAADPALAPVPPPPRRG